MHQCDLIKIRNYIQCQSTPLVLNSFNFMACRTHNAWIVYFGCIKHFNYFPVWFNLVQYIQRRLYL